MMTRTCSRSGKNMECNIKCNSDSARKVSGHMGRECLIGNNTEVHYLRNYAYSKENPEITQEDSTRVTQ